MEYWETKGIPVQQDSMEMYRALIAIVETYRVEQAGRFVGMESDEDDKVRLID